MTQTKLPPFVREYAIEGGCIYIHSNTPIAGRIAENFVIGKAPSGEHNKLEYSGFWILEGFVHDISLPEEQYPTLSYYLSERQNKELAERWVLFTQNVDENEALILIKCFNESRRHILETEVGKSLEEKKTDSSQES